MTAPHLCSVCEQPGHNALNCPTGGKPSRLSRQRRYQLRRKLDGLCQRCPAQIDEGTHCEDCRRKLEARRRELYRERHARVRDSYRCTLCRQQGHNRRACPGPASAEAAE